MVYPPVVVQVTDEAGLPVPAVEVAFNRFNAGVSANPVLTDNEGKAAVTMVIGYDTGEALLIAHLPAHPSVPHLTVTTRALPGRLDPMWLEPGGATIQQGTSFQARPRAFQSDYDIDVESPLTWTSSDASVATVSSSGVVSALSPGLATITATHYERVGGIFLRAPALVVVPVPAGPNGPGLTSFTMAVATGSGVTILRNDGTIEATISGCGDGCVLRSGASWSRDGRKLALVGERDTLAVLFVANRDGTDLHEVASVPRILLSYVRFNQFVYPALHPSWSADGRLVYVRARRNGLSLETVTADGTARTTVMVDTVPPFYPSDLERLTDPQWGLDDTMITARLGDQLYAMNPDGTNLRALTPPGALGRSGFPGEFVTSPYRWAPDGRTIAFRRHSDLVGSDAIVVLAPLSGAMREVAIPEGIDMDFCWDPVSSGFSFTHWSNRGPTDQDRWMSIYTINVDGTGLRRAVTALDVDDARRPGSGAWTPDREFLLFPDDRRYSDEPRGALYAQSLANGTNTRLGVLRDVNFFTIAEARGCIESPPWL